MKTRFFVLIAIALFLVGCAISPPKVSVPIVAPEVTTKLVYGQVAFTQRIVSNGKLLKSAYNRKFLLPEGVPDFTAFGKCSDIYPNDILHIFHFPRIAGEDLLNDYFYLFYAFFDPQLVEFIPIAIAYRNYDSDFNLIRKYWIYQDGMPQEATSEDVSALSDYYRTVEETMKEIGKEQKDT